MDRSVGSCLIILFLFSFLIGIQALSSSFFSPPSLGAAAPCRPDQKSDLLQFRKAMMPNSTSSSCQTDGFWSTTPNMISWNADEDCCSWEGVMCDQMTGHVIRLELGCYPPSQTCYSSVASSNSTKLSSLGSLNLSSPHKAERPSGSNSDMLLQNLTMLRILILDGLNMSGIDVSRLMNLPPSLEVLSLSSCQLCGTLAANIFLLPKLTCLNLSGNKELSGYLPESTWNSSLKVLELSSTGFSGVLPESIGDLHSLETLLLQQCNFIGSIPLSLGNLTRLTRLEFSSNKLSGEVPPTLSNLDRLTLLDLSFNNFTGPIPNVFDNKTQLQKLLFSHNHFEGPIPPSIKNLSNLARLEISNNHIWGSIPSSLFSLPSLTRLDLSNNNLSGHVNEFLAAPSLDQVDLSGNKLRGSIPNSIFQLGNLTYLSISGNNLTSVLDQRLLSRLINLKDLDLSDNILSLSNSITIDHVLPKLSKVSLSGCNITVMPAFLRNSTSVEYLDLSRNIIHGDIPPWMWDVGTESLSYLNISHNSLTSFEQVPWENLIVLDLYSNLIQGPFLPLSLPNSVRVFSLARNQVTGYIPGSICEMKGLQILDLSHNNFTGTIPHCLGNISDSLVVLDLQENGLSGTISLTFGENAVLRSLHLNGNKFEGLLPRSVINCKQLEALDLSGNKLNDTFPRWLEILPSLRVLFLRSNRLRGSIANPRTEFPFPQLRILDLSSNEFTGPLPSTYFAKLKAMMSTDQDRSELRYMDQGYYQDSVTEIIKGIEVNLPKILVTRTTVDLSSNKFQGMIPDVIGELGSLKGLNLSHNNLNGHIPSSLGDLSELEWLDLSSNELSGTVPTKLTNLTFLEVLNVSSNQLTGPIPRGNQFNTFQAESYRGNPGLCGFPLSKSCADSRVPGKLPVLPEGGVHSVFAEFVKPEAVEIGFLCGMVLGLVMSNLQYLRSFWREHRERLERLLGNIFLQWGLETDKVDNIICEPSED